MSLSDAELALLDRWQRGFPFVSRPFAAIAEAAGVSEQDTLDLFRKLQQQKIISRLGAIVKPHSAGVSTLCAMWVDPDKIEAVADAVSAEPLVTHNYERTHDYNLWFVIAGPDATAVADTHRSIERHTGLAVLDLRLQAAYHLDLGFSLTGKQYCRTDKPAVADGTGPDSTDRALLAALQDGLPIVPQPYANVAARMGLNEGEVIARLGRLANSGIVTRFGCIVRHRSLGYIANAMVVWDVPDDQADGHAASFVRNPRVTLCYRRRRHLPQWRYNLYCMVHATSREDALAVIADLNDSAGTALYPHSVLFSTRCFKQRGAVFSRQEGQVH